MIPRISATKFKTPYQYVISVVRARGVEVNNVRPLMAAMNRMGMPLYGCQSPDGYKNTQEVWLNPDALAQRISFATGIGLGRSPLATVIDDTIDNDPYAGELPQIRRRPMRCSASYRVGRWTAPECEGGPRHSRRSDFGANTRKNRSFGPSPLDAALVLGSPDFMRR